MQYGSRLVFVVLGSILLLSGCGLAQHQPSAKEEFMRGIVRSQSGQFFIVPCFSPEQRRLLPTQAFQTRYSKSVPTSGLPVYMELTGTPQPDLSWQVKRVLLAGDTVSACQRSLHNVRYRVQGWAPRWVADISEYHVTVNFLQTRTTLKFPIDQLDGIQLEWDSRMQGLEGHHALQLNLVKQGCYSQQGMWSPWQALMVLDGEEFSGCAYAGDVLQRAIYGRYSNKLDDTTTFVVMDVLADNRVQMLLDYRNGEPLSVISGKWQLQKNGHLHLQLTERDGQKVQELLILKRARNGQFIQVGYSDIFGRNGLYLSRSE